MSSCGRFPGSAGRRSTLGTVGRRTSCCPGASGESLSEAFRAQLNDRHAGMWPIIHGTVELYGPDPRIGGETEVLLGRGALVLLDSQESSRVGCYELLFYDESYVAPILRLPMGPRLKLAAQPMTPNGGSDARRQTMGGPLLTMRPSFDLSIPGGGPWGVVFDLEADAMAFARDFAVRYRLVALSVKTTRGWRTVRDLQDEIMEMRRRGLLASLERFFFQALFLICISLLVYACALYSNDSSRPILDVAVAAITDAWVAFTTSVGWASDLGATACGLLTPVVPIAEVQRCLAPSQADVRPCMANLVGSSTWLSWL